MATFNNGESGSSIRTKINNVLQHLDGTSGAVVVNDAGADVDFRVESDTNANALFVDGATGNVGVGTTLSPTNLAQTNSGTGFATGDNGLTTISRSGGQPLVLNRLSNDGNTISIRKDGVEVGALGVASGGLTVSTNATERMRIDSSGNVGIGTSAPANRLSVQQTFDTAANILANGSYAATFTSNALGDTSRAQGILIGGANTNIRGAAIVAEATASNNAHNMIFAVSSGSATPTERMRIDSSGNLLVGTTTLPSDSSFGFGVQKVGTGTTIINSRNATATVTHLSFYNPNGQVGSITTSGTATSYNTSSDYRLKEDVQPMVGATERILALNPVNFAWKADGSRTDGFIAHEAQEVAPYAVTGEKDGEEMQAIDHSKLVPLLTAALQDALKRIEALEAK